MSPQAPPLSQFTLIRARTPADIAATKSLFEAYVQWLDINLDFQGYASEFAALPGKYAPPHGEILLACRNSDGEALGCMAIRYLAEERIDGGAVPRRICEFKRFFVTPEARGMGVGGALIAEAVRVAREELVYDEAKLDTLMPRMIGAVKLYQKYGFEECEAYYGNVLEGVLFMRCDLKRDLRERERQEERS